MNVPDDRLPFVLRRLMQFKSILRAQHGVDDQTLITALMVDCAGAARSQGLTREQFVSALSDVWDAAEQAQQRIEAGLPGGKRNQA
jgi:hypothetical protein